MPYNIIDVVDQRTAFMTNISIPFSAVMEVRDEHSIAEICRLRAKVWHDTGKLVDDAFDDQGWRDPIDSNCRHWVVTDVHNTIVAAGRLSIHDGIDEVHQSHEYRNHGIQFPGTYANPDRVVVEQSLAGYGLGRAILDAQDAAIEAHGAQFSVRQASPAMVRLLLRRGWTIAGPAASDARFPGVQFSVVIRPVGTASESNRDFQNWIQQRKAAA